MLNPFRTKKKKKRKDVKQSVASGTRNRRNDASSSLSKKVSSPKREKSNNNRRTPVQSVTVASSSSSEQEIEQLPHNQEGANNKGGVPTDQLRRLIKRSSVRIEEKQDTKEAHDRNNDNCSMCFLEEHNAVLKTMRESWGVSADHFTLAMSQSEPLARSPLKSVQDAIIVTESWNKALAFRSMFSEAIVGRWRMLVAVSDHEDFVPVTIPLRRQSITSSEGTIRRSSLILRTFNPNSSSDKQAALYQVEKNIDPLACCFGLTMSNIESLVIGLIDMAVRELCPHNQIVQREAYRPLQGSSDTDQSISNPFIHYNECNSFDEYGILFARYGLKPKYWIDFCNAFIWAMKTHNPYAHQDQDTEDFEKPTHESAHSMFVAGKIALPMVEASLRYENYLKQRVFRQLQQFYESYQSEFNTVDTFKDGFSALFEQHPGLEDHFGTNEVENILVELLTMMQHLVEDLQDIRIPNSEIRRLLSEQGEMWVERQVPFDFVALLGNEYLVTVQPYFHKNAGHSLAKRLGIALAYIFKEAMYFIMQPMVVDRNLRTAVNKFYKEVAPELDWSDQVLQKRMIEVSSEILATGTYTQTSEEIEIGARLAWRNSGKCIGRIAWNTLKVRDCRHLYSAETIFHEIEEHIRMASGGTNIQSVMTVFRPQQSNEAFGMRFWSSQVFRYAGYKNKDNGETLGDPANAEFTEYLIKSKLWSPPSVRTAFDLLPLVLKMPQIDKPFIYNIPHDLAHELDIEHPQFPAVKDLHLKWAAIPAITNFKMNLGGLIYPCMPFNGWFLSTEIARNLLERYSMTIPLAKAMDIPSNDRMLLQKVTAEFENALLHSFEKQEYTIVDPMTVGKSFMTHCQRERKAGRECPGQWSWIGGLVGPTNPTWHLEMRDFKKEPQYDYCCEPWQVINLDNEGNNDDELLDTTSHKLNSVALANGYDSKVKTQDKIPRVLIAFGSETGNAEAVAYSLARKLKICKPKVMCLNDIVRKEEKISQFTHFLAICSTFGNGEPPSNAKAFFETPLDVMTKKVSCAVLALGSSLYPKFCQAGKDLHSMIMEVGGDSLMKLTCIDGVKDSQQQIMQWSERTSNLVLPASLISDLTFMAGENGKESSADSTYEVKWKHEYDNLPTELKSFTFSPRVTMSCQRNYELFADANKSLRSTRHIEFSVPSSVKYQTGDHLSVSPVNDLLMVQRFFHCFAYQLTKAAIVNGYHRSSTPKIVENENSFLTPQIIWLVQQPFYVEEQGEEQQLLVDIPHLTNVTLLEAIQAHVDLSLDQNSYSEDLISMMMDRLDKSSFVSPLATKFRLFVKNILNKPSDVKSKRISDVHPTIVHLLEEFGSLFCEPLPDRKVPLVSLADILVLLPRLNPRYYSISSSAQSSPSTVSITVGRVYNESKDGELIKGVCSNYLANLQPGDTAKIAIKTSTFRPPKSKDAPIIMVGAGTGIAPFMGFLKKRSKEWFTGSNRNVNDCYLFFGCRSKNEIPYRDELFSWQSAKIVKLYLALSRDSRRLPKQYVHEQLKLHGPKVNSLLQKDNSHFFICGDTNMAAASTKMCIEILINNGGMSRVAAVQHINQMRVDNRLQFDIYGTDVSDLSDSFKERDQSKQTSALAGSIWSQHFLHSSSREFTVNNMKDNAENNDDDDDDTKDNLVDNMEGNTVEDMKDDTVDVTEDDTVDNTKDNTTDTDENINENIGNTIDENIEEDNIKDSTDKNTEYNINDDIEDNIKINTNDNTNDDIEDNTD